MQYNDVAITLLSESSDNFIYCYASDTSYEDAINDATVYKISYCHKREKVFEDTNYNLHYYVVPLNITPIDLTKSEKNMSNNPDTYEDGSKQATILQFFAYEHLPEHLQEVSQEFYYMARYLDRVITTSAEKSVALRKLLESKDSAVRAAIVSTNQSKGIY